MQKDEDSSVPTLAASHNIEAFPDLPKVLHALANKLLPIVAFSELGIRKTQDPMLLNYFEKIRHAAGDARDLIVSLRLEFQERERNTRSNALNSAGDSLQRESQETKPPTKS